jgi:hypothetical protein
VGREDRLRARAIVGREMLGNGPGQAESVERRGTAADLVQDDQAAVGRRPEDRGCLLHFDHERGLPARDVVGRADAREDSVHD